MKIFKIINAVKIVGLRSLLKYGLAASGSEVLVNIKGTNVVVRKGTPDLRVAIDCLSGEFEVLRYLLPHGYDGNIVDAGGYIGTSAIALHNIFPQANITVIEPSVANLEVLKKNVAGIGNIKIVHGALVGKSAGTINLKNRGTGEWGFTIVEAPKDKSDASVLHETQAFTLKDLIASSGGIGLLKMDIEGGEVDLLKHDLETLNSIPVVYAELHDRIIDGCTDLFFNYSSDRVLIKDKGQKYLSISREVAVTA